MSHLFDPLTLRSVRLKNRIAVSSMCQYCSVDGLASDWHLVHLGSRAVGGAALVMTEATAVTAEGRISPEDLGLWHEGQIEPLARVARFIAAQGAVAGIQLAHSGRKGSSYRPWSPVQGTIPPGAGGWPTVAPSPEGYSSAMAVPRELSEAEIAAVITAFRAAAERALRAGFRVIEIHAAHGYLLHGFLSPATNCRADRWGGGFEGRTRILSEVVDAVRAVWPESLPVLVRMSATDWDPGGWTIEDSIRLARALRERGVDLLDCSSGGNISGVRIPIGPGYQVGLAERIRREAGISTAAVGLITEPHQADEIIRNGQADLVFLARAMLRDPYWPLHAAAALGHPIEWPAQYLRAAPAGTPARPA